MATLGTSMATAHWIIITFDGAGCTDHDSGVRLAIFCGSVKLLNQSPNSIYNLVTYRAADHAEHLVTLNARFSGVRPALCRCATRGPLEIRKHYKSLSDNLKLKFLTDWHKSHNATDYNESPAFPYHAVFCDLLHLYLNNFNAAMVEAFDRHLRADYKDNATIQAVQTDCRDKINALLRAPGANLYMQLGTDAKHAATGPAMYKIMQHPTLLADCMDAMQPLWDLLEATSNMQEQGAEGPTVVYVDELEGDDAVVPQL